MKTNKVFFSTHFSNTFGSMVVCSYTSAVMISEFVNTMDNTCPLSNFIINTRAYLLLFLIRIRGTLIVDDFDILTISEFKRIETISDMYYKYCSQDYSKCTNTDTIPTNSINCLIELIMLLDIYT